MIKKILITITLFATNLFCYAQIDEKQKLDIFYARNIELYNSLEDGKITESQDLYKSLANDNIVNVFIELLYNYKMADYANKPNTSIFYLERLLSLDRTRSVEYYSRLNYLYFKTKRYDDIIKHNKRTLEEIIENGNLDKEGLGEWEDFFSHRDLWAETSKKKKKLTIERSTTINSIDFIDDDIIIFDVKYNEKTFKTTFDTGVSEHFTVRKHMAEKMGLRKIELPKGGNPFASTTFNGKELNIEGYIADSISFAGIKLYNVPITVFEDDVRSMYPDSTLQRSGVLSKLNKFIERTDIVMGLPTMLLLERLVIDVNTKTITFLPESTEQKPQNLFLIMNELYAKISVNNTPFIGFLDTGAESFLELDSTFYDKNKSRIAIDTLAFKKPLNASSITLMQENIPYEITKDVDVKLNDLSITYPKSENIIIYDTKPFSGQVDKHNGIIGYDFFKALNSKILFDFVDMYIEVLEDKN